MTNRELSDYYAELSRRYAELAKLDSITQHMDAHGKVVTEQVATKRIVTEARITELLRTPTNATLADRTEEISPP